MDGGQRVGGGEEREERRGEGIAGWQDGRMWDGSIFSPLSIAIYISSREVARKYSMGSDIALPYP